LPLELPEKARALTVLSERGGNIRYEIKVNDLIAPLPAGYPAGSITFYDDNGALAIAELLTPHELEAGNPFKRLFDTMLLFFKEIFS
jgi:hypothetical protein